MAKLADWRERFLEQFNGQFTLGRYEGTSSLDGTPTIDSASILTFIAEAVDDAVTKQVKETLDYTDKEVKKAEQRGYEKVLSEAIQVREDQVSVMLRSTEQQAIESFCGELKKEALLMSCDLGIKQAVLIEDVDALKAKYLKGEK